MTELAAACTVRDATADDAAALARVEVETWQAAYAEILPHAWLAALSIEDKTVSWLRALAIVRSTRPVLVTEHDGEIVGFASGRASRDRSRLASLDALYVLPAFHGRGIGGALVLEMASRASNVGIGAMCVEVLAKNAHARHFYRRRGASEVTRSWRFFGGKPVVVVAYGWLLPSALERMRR